MSQEGAPTQREQPGTGADFVAWVAPALGAVRTEELLALLSREDPSDGRLVRSERARAAIISALRELHAAGELRPTALMIAERAGVSVRNVWQQFADLETLLVEAARRDVRFLLQLASVTDVGQPMSRRIRWLAEQRSQIFTKMGPGWRAAQLHEPFSDELRRSRRANVYLARAELETLFEPELSRLEPPRRRRLVDSLLAVTLWPFWNSLDLDLAQSPRQASGTIRSIMTALFETAGIEVA